MGNVRVGACFKSSNSQPSKVHIHCTNMYTAMHIHDVEHRACSRHCLDMGAQAGNAPHRSPFLSLPYGKEKKERKLETIALCIVSCQKDKMVLGAKKKAFEASCFLTRGVAPLATSPTSPARSGTTPVGVRQEEGHSDALRNASRHTSANTRQTSGTSCRAEPPALQSGPNVVS